MFAYKPCKRSTYTFEYWFAADLKKQINFNTFAFSSFKLKRRFFIRGQEQLYVTRETDGILPRYFTKN